MAAPGSAHLSRRSRPPLDAVVSCVWTSERAALAHPREWGQPTGRADLIVPLLDDAIIRYAGLADERGTRHRGAVLQGVQQRAFLRDASRPARTVGAQFRAGALSALFAVPAHELTDAVVPLQALWGLRA